MDKVVITYHAIRQARSRFQVWLDINEWAATLQLKAAVEAGLDIGVQCWDGFAREIMFPDNTRAAAVGTRCRGELVVKTVLTLDQLASNIRQIGLRAPGAKHTSRHQKRQKYRRKSVDRSIELEDDEI